jgi:hypothetical protein
MGILFEGWLRKTRDLQKDVYFINYEGDGG